MTDEVRGASRLVVTATREVTTLVEEMNRAIAGPLFGLTHPAGGLVYKAIRGVASVVGSGLDQTFATLAPVIGSREPGPRQDAARAVMNGVFGDHLVATENPLAIPMQLRVGGRPVALTAEGLRAALPEAGPRPLVLVHGSCMNDRQWLRRGHEHGAALARDLGYTPIWANYNSGLHISTNGRALAGLLEALAAAWPVPIEGLTLLGHSMGGLVSRSACAVAEAEGHGWREHLTHLVGLGVPHHGAPLERAGSVLHAALGIARETAPLRRLARIRSAGVTDLRYGHVLDAHWQGEDRFALRADRRVPVPLPAGVRCYAVAGTLARTMKEFLPGDGMVPVASALGDHVRSDLALAFPEGHRHIALGTGHLDLLDSPEVYATLRDWLSA